MMIIGCDFHPSWQQISWLDTETGEAGERKLVHASGDAKQFYEQLAGPVLIGMEATGNSQWFIELVEDLGHTIWVGDAAQIRASFVRKQKTDKRDAAHILKLVVEGRFPRLWTPDREQRDLRQLILQSPQAGGDTQPGEERTATPFSEQGNAEEVQAVESRGTTVVARASAETVGVVPARRLAGVAGDVKPAGRQAGCRSAKSGGRKCAGEASDDAAGSRSEHGAGIRADHRRCKPLSARQADRELHRPDSARRKFGRTAEAGRDHQARQPHAAFVAGGSRANSSSLRSRISQRVPASLSSEAQRRGQGGGGAQVGGATVLDAAHAEAVSGSRSYREQPAGAPGRRKLDRWIDWALSHPARGGMFA